MKTRLLVLLLLPVVLRAQNDTINVTDSLGQKQGHWVFFGKDFPNSGVGASDILEEGDFVNDQRTGIWMRYGMNTQVKAVMLFRIDKKTKASVRDQFYNYTYYDNGQLKRKPVIGSCRTMSDYFEYDEAGNVREIELFDSVCNTAYKLQRIQKGELDSISIFMVDDKLSEQPESETEKPRNTAHFGQSGEFCVDYNHQLFQIGTFEKGLFLSGREYLLDDMMRVLRIRYFENGKLVKTLVKKTV